MELGLNNIHGMVFRTSFQNGSFTGPSGPCGAQPRPGEPGLPIEV